MSIASETTVQPAPIDFAGVALAIRASYAALVYGFASTEETRYYLNGFCAEPAPDGWSGATVCATDGSRFGILRDDLAYCQPETRHIWQFDAATLKACKAKGSRYTNFEPWLVILATDKPGNYVAHIVFAGKDIADAIALARATDAPAGMRAHIAFIKPIDGTFPEYRRVVPGDTDNAFPGAINHHLLKPFIAVACETERMACLQLCGTDDKSPLLVKTSRSDFIGVLVPVRFVASTTLAWLKPKEAETPVENTDAA